jgi:hypothetical protein
VCDHDKFTFEVWFSKLDTRQPFFRVGHQCLRFQCCWGCVGVPVTHTVGFCERRRNCSACERALGRVDFPGTESCVRESTQKPRVLSYSKRTSRQIRTAIPRGSHSNRKAIRQDTETHIQPTKPTTSDRDAGILVCFQ